MNAGINLEMKRKERNLTQDEVAQYLGISRNTLAAYESGKTKIPASVFIYLADLYKCSVFDIFGVYTDEIEYDVPMIELIKAQARSKTNTERLKDAGFEKYSDKYYKDRYNHYVEELRKTFNV